MPDKDTFQRRADLTPNPVGGATPASPSPGANTGGSLGGWGFDAGAFFAPGIQLNSGAQASIAIGSPVPTGPAAGTGIWLDQTGLIGLLGGVQQAYFDASGQFNLHGGKMVGNAAGLGIGSPTAPISELSGTGLFLNGNGLYGLRSSVQTLKIDTATGSIKWTNAAYIGELQGYLDYITSTTGLILGQYAVTQIGEGSWQGTRAIPTYSVDTPLTYGQWISIDPTNGIRIMNANKNLGRWKANGDFLIGTDLSAAATTNLAVFNAAQTYNSESMGIGDLLLGDNSINKANLKWVKATGELLLRSGQTANVKIDTSGSLAMLADSGKYLRFFTSLDAEVGSLSATSLPTNYDWIYLSANGPGNQPEGRVRLNAHDNAAHITELQVTYNAAFGGTVDMYDASAGTFMGLCIGSSRNDGVVPAAVALDARGPIVQAISANAQQLGIRTLTELTTIAAAATTDTAIQIPANAVVLGVSARTTTTIPTAATFTVTGATSGTAFQTAAVSATAGGTDAGTASCPYRNGATQKIRITPNATPGTNAGRVRVTIHYYEIIPPSS